MIERRKPNPNAPEYRPERRHPQPQQNASTPAKPDPRRSVEWRGWRGDDVVSDRHTD
jgi:hypothetical protein